MYPNISKDLQSLNYTNKQHQCNISWPAFHCAVVIPGIANNFEFIVFWLYNTYLVTVSISGVIVYLFTIANSYRVSLYVCGVRVCMHV